MLPDLKSKCHLIKYCTLSWRDYCNAYRNVKLLWWQDCCRNEPNLYRDLVHVVKHFIRKNHRRSKKMYKVCMFIATSCFLLSLNNITNNKYFQEMILAILKLKEQLLLPYKKSSQKIVRDVLSNVEVSNKGGTFKFNNNLLNKTIYISCCVCMCILFILHPHMFYILDLKMSCQDKNVHLRESGQLISFISNVCESSSQTEELPEIIQHTLALESANNSNGINTPSDDDISSLSCQV